MEGDGPLAQFKFTENYPLLYDSTKAQQKSSGPSRNEQYPPYQFAIAFLYQGDQHLVEPLSKWWSSLVFCSRKVKHGPPL
ncbi:unnamed protein product [Prunus armeniaca]|uniref:Uncharacterized protein n=1 Tax=Prunus armeniaca TaxID=36596 RepID=A0A6J5VJC6_PRUAR|nr:unnamed protein product [Prunus armeniaca]